MMGYAGRKEPSEGVHDDLFVNVVALADAETTVLLAAFDVATFDAEGVQLINKEVGKQTGIEADNITLNTSHTHAGPIVAHRTYVPFDEAYMDSLAANTVDAAGRAVSDLSPAVLRAGAAPVDIGCNRRRRGADGRIELRPNPAGTRLAEVSVLHFVRPAAFDVVLFSLPAHGTTLGGDNLLISADWIGAAVREIEKKLKGPKAVFLQGCAGNQNAYRGRGFEQVAEHGKTVCAAVDKALLDSEELSGLPLRKTNRDMPLPTAAGGVRHCPLHALRLGEAILIGLGGEAFVEYALFARQISRARSTIVLGYTDAVVGYLPTEAAYSEGGYETNAYTWIPGGEPWDPSLEKVIREEIEAALQDLMSA